MKKFNKILSMLLVFAMALTMLPTSAMAVVSERTGETGSKYVEGVPAGDRNLMNSLRENYPQQASKGENLALGTDVIVTEDKNPTVSLDKGNNEDALISTYRENDIVRVIVVLQGAPLLEQGFSTDEIAAYGSAVQAQVDKMHTMQRTLVREINVLVQSAMPEVYSGRIEAKYNYSVTMNGIAVEVPY
ncbi:MAG: hypothetical protein IKM11_05470, partial [Oscillospiraceae bacterium]|nr:hypothetical protein [Oscillospiraceae bacterium]